ncbi:L-2-hydroxyglutarate oxidase [Chitinivorax sp. B]|uniref:L-2-hydroxyglutarate oxidase n=1 Tax=Chitinivorax sp. B TaxID=2502235 RepID=UPI0010F97205|nr:L-2-hydroxyglutarate oxidase [Chitinivorax sp. B]
MHTKTFDFVVIGAGIVGLTVALELRQRYAHASIAVLEKEARPGMHASGRNSGVLHCGIYYGSDTLKAKVCARGAARMLEFARTEKIAFSQCGKVILATDDSQLPTVQKLLRNASENGIEAHLIDHHILREIEPYATDGPAAIHCPTTAVIDSVAVVKRLHEMLAAQNVQFLLDCVVRTIRPSGSLNTSLGDVHYGFLYNCAGAYADTIAKCFGQAEDYALVPFKGIYWKLNAAANPKIRANIYPVPDVTLPFLGVHLTRVISGEVYIGPTAIPAFGRENYDKLHGIQLNEAAAISRQLMSMYLRNDGNFRKLAHAEISKYWKHNFLSAARKLIPSLDARDMIATPKAGIRPQLINTRTRKLEMDYILARTPNTLHVLNAISPAFTSSLAFAELIVDAAECSAAPATSHPANHDLAAPAAAVGMVENC